MDRIKLEDGRVAEVSFISRKDSTWEFLRFINALVEEKAFVFYDKRFTLKEEEKWKKDQLDALRKKDGYVLVARVGGKLAGNSGARMDGHKARNNVQIGIVIAKEYRGGRAWRSPPQAQYQDRKEILQAKAEEHLSDGLCAKQTSIFTLHKTGIQRIRKAPKMVAPQREICRSYLHETLGYSSCVLHCGSSWK